MARYDVFNGDADGLCALQQLRLEQPADAVIVTGPKRDVHLLERVRAQPGDIVTVLDISVDTNRGALARVLAAGAHVQWFDHHYAGEIVPTANFEAHIDTSPGTCTSLIVDGHLRGKWRTWAIVAAFGDNLDAVAHRLAKAEGIPEDLVAKLRDLGQCLNYNAYGDTVADLYYDPADLARRLRDHEDPFSFIREQPVMKTLQIGYSEDMANALRTDPKVVGGHTRAYFLPDAPWARRVIGVFANGVASSEPDHAHAVFAARRDGTYTVSVRAPLGRPWGADELVRAFPTGGGRKAAGGIDRLPHSEVDKFLAAFNAKFAAG